MDSSRYRLSPHLVDLLPAHSEKRLFGEPPTGLHPTTLGYSKLSGFSLSAFFHAYFALYGPYLLVFPYIVYCLSAILTFFYRVQSGKSAHPLSWHYYLTLLTPKYGPTAPNFPFQALDGTSTVLLNLTYGHHAGVSNTHLWDQ